MTDEPKNTEKVKLYRKRLTDFKQDEQNANAGSPRGNAMLELSLREYGAGRSLLADADDVLIGGNKTQRQAEQAGMQEVIVVETEGEALIVHKRRDLHLDQDAKARELAYMDNRAAEVNLAWDANQVAADIAAGVDLSLMFYDDELDKIAGEVLAEPEEETEEDVFPEMELQPFEHYDYVMLAFKDHFDWSRALDLLGLQKEGFTVTKKQRKIGLMRVIDGRKVLELCESLSPAVNE